MSNPEEPPDDVDSAFYFPIPLWYTQRDIALGVKRRRKEKRNGDADMIASSGTTQLPSHISSITFFCMQAALSDPYLTFPIENQPLPPLPFLCTCCTHHQRRIRPSLHSRDPILLLLLSIPSFSHRAHTSSLLSPQSILLARYFSITTGGQKKKTRRRPPLLGAQERAKWEVPHPFLLIQAGKPYLSIGNPSCNRDWAESEKDWGRGRRGRPTN